MKFAICNEQYGGWSFPRVCEHVASCGYDGVELAPFVFHEDPGQLSLKDARQIRATAGAAGLEVVGFHWLLASPKGLHLTTADDAIRARTAAFLQHLVRLCAESGGRVMVFGSPKQRDLKPGTGYDDAFQRGVQVCRAVCEVAGNLGVTLAMEPLGPAETNFLVYIDETLRFIEAVDHPACSLHLDVKAMVQEATPVPDLIRAHGPTAAHFHANDANLRGPGFGETDFVPIGEALRDAAYDGYVSIEVFDDTVDPVETATRGLAYLKDTFRAAGVIE